jgi:hypothetical protein
MADVIASHLKNEEAELDVAIYLFDRFRRKTAMDYIKFFEEFSARSRQLGDGATVATMVGGDQEPSWKVTKKASAEVLQRRELVDKLAALSQERDLLERRIAEAQEALSARVKGDIEARLASIHHQRLELLSQLHTQQGDREGVSVFVSYSHVDKDLQGELMKHLRGLERDRLVRVWHDRMITAGSEWKGAIDQSLEEAHIILLLVSADFVYSDYCYDIEMKRALERHERREAVVIPVILRPVVWNNCPFSKLQALPADAKPVTEWGNRDRAFVSIVEGVRSAIEDLIKKILPQVNG